jgi:hypothetical protein
MENPHLEMDDKQGYPPWLRKPPFDQAWKFPNSIVYIKTTEVATRPVDRQEPTDLMLRTTKKNPSLATPAVMITIL